MRLINKYPIHRYNGYTYSCNIHYCNSKVYSNYKSKKQGCGKCGSYPKPVVAVAVINL